MNSLNYYESIAILAELQEMEDEGATAPPLAPAAVKAFCAESEYEERLYVAVGTVRESLKKGDPAEAARLLDALLAKLLNHLDVVAFSHTALTHMAQDLKQAPLPSTPEMTREVHHG